MAILPWVTIESLLGAFHATAVSIRRSLSVYKLTLLLFNAAPSADPLIMLLRLASAGVCEVFFCTTDQWPQAPVSDRVSTNRLSLTRITLAWDTIFPPFTPLDADVSNWPLRFNWLSLAAELSMICPCDIKVLFACNTPVLLTTEAKALLAAPAVNINLPPSACINPPLEANAFNWF